MLCFERQRLQGSVLKLSSGSKAGTHNSNLKRRLVYKYGSSPCWSRGLCSQGQHRRHAIAQDNMSCSVVSLSSSEMLQGPDNCSPFKNCDGLLALPLPTANLFPLTIQER